MTHKQQIVASARHWNREGIWAAKNGMRDLAEHMFKAARARVTKARGVMA